MSRHEDDGGNRSSSDEGDGDRLDEESSDAGEFSDWVDETAVAAAGAAEEDTKAGGWLGRVFGRDSDEPAEGSDADVAVDEPPDAHLGADPDSLSVFSAVQIEDDEDLDDELDADFDDEDEVEYEDDEDLDDEPDADEDETEYEDDAFDADFDEEDEVEYEDDEDLDDELDADAVEVEYEGDDSDAESDDAIEDDVADEDHVDDEGDTEATGEQAEVLEMPQSGSADSDPTFEELWGGDDDDDPDLEIIDFASFTSEDYVQATTREYAGLAEAVARAEEEDTQRIAVSAEIPGLESGIVGLEDVVDATGDEGTADVVEPPSASDLPMRVLTALGLIVLFAASLLSPYGIGALIVVVLGIAAGEMYSALIRAGYRPLSIFGFVGIGGAFFGTWAAGPIAIPISLLLGAIAVFLFYATVPGRRAVLENATLTLLVMAWIGGLGGLAFDLLGSDDYQWLVLGLVLTVAGMDIAQYFVGRRIGKHQLAPQVSPKKTIEGYVAGVVVAVGMGAAFGLAEPFDVTDGLIIGAVVAVIAPLGDLAVSVLKRALGVKDMGYILPGHGGVLDRVDAMIMTIPALWLAYSWMGLVN